MLAEALNFVATLAISPRRRADEINSSVRLWARARRCARDWQAHERRCHAAVRRAVEGLSSRRVAVVLGSGLLRDVPIAWLSQQFDEVRLYDLQHLASVRLWASAKRLRNLRFIYRDLSGSMDFLGTDQAIDFVISANILSQIGVGAVRRDIEPKPLIRAHVEAITGLAGRGLLLTDIEYTIIAKDGSTIDQGDLMHGVAIGQTLDSWDWTVAPYGELDPGYQAVHRVIAVKL